MNQCAFWVSAIISHIFTFEIIWLSYKDAQKVTFLLEKAHDIGIKAYICSICAYTSAGFLYSYVEVACDRSFNALKTGVILIVLLIIWGGVFSILAMPISDVKEEMKEVITLDMCIALLESVVFFFVCKEYTHMVYFISFLIGKLFWLDNINLGEVHKTKEKFEEAVNLQGKQATLLYAIILVAVFLVGTLSKAETIEIIQEICLGIRAGIPTSIISLLAIYFISKCGQKQVHKNTQNKDGEM